MKRHFPLALLILCLSLLLGCTGRNTPARTSCAPQKPLPPAQTAQTLPPVTEETEPLPATTQAVQTQPEETEIPVTEPAETQPLHTDLYIPGAEPVDVVLYFNEVCLNAEYVNSGDPTALQKWASPIYYYIDGDPTPQDLETVHRFDQWLNGIEGFPGIYETLDPLAANLQIIFCSQPELVDRMGAHFRDSDGAVTFWYADNQIYDAIICIRTDLDQELRSSVILEEMYNGLGPIQDTALRTDSIIFAGFSQPQALTAMDELILKLLYHPDMVCGMDATQCAQIIRRLYY